MTTPTRPPPRKPADADRVAAALADATIMGDGKAAEKYGVSTRTIRQWRTDAKESRPDVGAKAAANLQSALQEAHEDRVASRAEKIDEALDEAIEYIRWAAATRDKRPNAMMVQSLVSGLKALQEIKGGKETEGGTSAGFQVTITPFGSKTPDPA